MISMAHINFEEQAAAADADKTLSPRLGSAQAEEILESSTAAGSSDSEGSVIMERTECQRAMQEKVKAVLQRLKEHGEAIRKLEENVSDFINEFNIDSDSVGEAVQRSQQLQKQARNYGEDVLEDMLSLDRLEGLFPEDRAGRKSAYAGLESLLDDVDAIKANLVKLQKSLETVQTQYQQECVEDVHPVLSTPESKLNSSGIDRKSLQIPAPRCDLWKALSLSLDFASKELPTHYIASAAVPKLEDVELRLSADGSRLTVTGVQLPTTEEIHSMQDQLRTYFERNGHDYTDSRKASQEAAKFYARVGQGRYGRFSTSFRLPPSVEAEDIRASYDAGILSIQLPKKVHPTPRTCYRGYGERMPRRLWR